MITLTLEEVKSYLRIDYEEDDENLINLIEVSEAYIDSCVGTLYKNDEKIIYSCICCKCIWARNRKRFVFRIE